MEQNREPGNKSSLNDQSIHTEGCQGPQGGEDGLFSKRCWGHTRKMKLNPFLPRCTKIDSKWIEEFNVLPETIRLLEENLGSEL